MTTPPNTEPSKPPYLGICGDKPVDIRCGPLARYLGMENGVWRGAIMIVTSDDNSDYSDGPTLVVNIGSEEQVRGQVISKELGHTFWRFLLKVTMKPDDETQLMYRLKGDEGGKTANCIVVPCAQQSMNVMFHSCNGFSLGADPSLFPGCLWADVLRKHKDTPFHVMIGGGDQIYCDLIKTKCDSIRAWANSRNHHKKSHTQFSDNVLHEAESFMLNHYMDWFGLGYWKGPKGATVQTHLTKAFATIPMINIFDDHDIIDGFGSYRDRTMRMPVMSGLGNVAFKYYMLFQMCEPPSGQKNHSDEDPGYVLARQPGPYIKQPNRSIYARLGKHMAFYGLDCRTERKLDQVCTQDTYQAMFARLYRESKASDGQISHLLLMLGVPVLYPRLVWLEWLLTSRAMSPMKALLVKGMGQRGLVNEFHGSIEILDDLNDHWCAKHHKAERNRLLAQIHKFTAETGVRVTILSGDVHLAAVGRMFTQSLSATTQQDPCLIFNVTSSAIVNTPPGDKMADFLNKRNKLHHFTSTIKEDLVKVFTHDTDKSTRNNRCLLPRRNWCSVSLRGSQSASDSHQASKVPGPLFTGDTPDANSSNAHELGYPNDPDSLSVKLNIEKDRSTDQGETVAYEILVPSFQTAH